MPAPVECAAKRQQPGRLGIGMSPPEIEHALDATRHASIAVIELEERLEQTGGPRREEARARRRVEIKKRRHAEVRVAEVSPRPVDRVVEEIARVRIARVPG